MGKITLMINQDDCNGCHACEVACKQEHGLGVGPRVVRVIEKSPLFVPLFCHHCEDTPCALACPEDAITKDPETGVVLLEPEKCDGCNAVEGKSGVEKQDTSPCKVECPAHNDVQGYVGLAAKGKYQEAIQLIKNTSSFPSVCGRVCPHPCESKCNRDQIDEPVAIRSIERFLADQDLSSKNPYVPEVREVREEKIAIIGSGPAGLTAAYFLAREGYKLTVFEKLPVAGGMMVVGIPSYRLPKDILSAEIKVIQDMGVEIKTGVTFGEDITFESLKKDGYQAFFVAIGLHKDRRLNLEKEDMDGVLKGVDFLRDVSLGNPVSVGKKVIVVGGGNVAMDVALCSIRKGAKEVSVVCLEQRDEMPAWEHEIQMALEEGVKIINGLGPNKFLEKGGKFSGIEFKRCTSVFDEDGAFNPKYDAANLTKLKGDTAVIAIGQAADLSFAEKQGVVVSSTGALEADPMTLETPIKGVFAGGDVYYGPKTVAEAIGSGKEAAVSIDRYIKGLDLRAGRDLRDTKLTSITEPQKEKYDPVARAQMPCQEPKKRVKNFEEIQLGFIEEMAVQEAKRCISCGTCCVQACPYGVMQFNHEVTKAVKCDLCVQKRGNNEAPACSLICPAHCIFWGDPAAFPSEADKGIQKSVP
ncbi:MAG: FAD-dependent oxidoreductase [Desulfobacteraceae bacterium]|jgi:NADPH-dependent glutamate synthase beta subunit-like oxidoreductase